MKLRIPSRQRRGRLQIIPLIDIMFFLLASFMIVSLHKIRVDSLKLSLPTNIPGTTPEQQNDFTSISLDAAGVVQIDKEVMANDQQLAQKLQAIYQAQPEKKILMSADESARHGNVMLLLGKLRQVGFQKVAFNIKNQGLSMIQPAPAASPAEATNQAPEQPEEKKEHDHD